MISSALIHNYTLPRRLLTLNAAAIALNERLVSRKILRSKGTLGGRSAPPLTQLIGGARSVAGGSNGARAARTLGAGSAVVLDLLVGGDARGKRHQEHRDCELQHGCLDRQVPPLSKTGRKVESKEERNTTDGEKARGKER